MKDSLSTHGRFRDSYQLNLCCNISGNVGLSQNTWELREGAEVALLASQRAFAGEEWISLAPSVPAYGSIPLYLESPEMVREALSGMDWAFTDDETTFLTHDIHPYPAKFIPQIPGNLISVLSGRGELVLDPFGGSGTTALEAVRLGRRALSVDANPVASLIGAVKTARLDSEVSAELAGLHASLASEAVSLPENPKVLMDRHSSFIPAIANREKWFADTATGELALIRFRISRLESRLARDVANLAMSRMVLKVSFQDSETRYKSTPRVVTIGETINRYVKELEIMVRSLLRTGAATRYGVSEFITADIRTISESTIQPQSVDLVVTSPPYGNANDYHLYHRFRLLWLGYDPIALGRVEIGSHLRHQREGSGFDSYLGDLTVALRCISRALKPGRYAALVLGDALYEGTLHSTSAALKEQAQRFGFDAAFSVTRPVHKTKRSFTVAGRRTSSEHILLMRKKTASVKVFFGPPPYRLFPYEEYLRRCEVQIVTNQTSLPRTLDGEFALSPAALIASRRLVFTHRINLDGGESGRTWQAILENGLATSVGNRKDPKYVTHGLHPYKGKFYPQLAKALLNTARLRDGAAVLDPFCGSGTTLLEGFLNGLRTRGIDMNPLAALIARAKVGILDLSPEVVTEAVEAILAKLAKAPDTPDYNDDEFRRECLQEIARWFPSPVIAKLNWLLKTIRRTTAGPISDFFQVVLSSIVRDVSQQDPNDLRIRYRKVLLDDEDVFGLFSQHLAAHFGRLQKFWSVRGYSPCEFYPAAAIEGDSRSWDAFERLGIKAGGVDAVLTSPPYATALPYIDTDRLSLLTVMGISGQGRRPLEQALIGSREIVTSERNAFEEKIAHASIDLNKDVGGFLQSLHHRLARADVGFRRKNMPALLIRFFADMKAVLTNCYTALRPGGEAMIVIGDNRIEIGGVDERIPTTDFISSLGVSVGFSMVEEFDISVTTENLVHIKNAITHNRVLRLRRD